MECLLSDLQGGYLIDYFVLAISTGAIVLSVTSSILSWRVMMLLERGQLKVTNGNSSNGATSTASRPKYFV